MLSAPRSSQLTPKMPVSMGIVLGGDWRTPSCSTASPQCLGHLGMGIYGAGDNSYGAEGEQGVKSAAVPLWKW